MRILGYALVVGVLIFGAMSAQARELSERERFVCNFGAGIAGAAQASKLSGVSLYGARRKLQDRKFPRPGMRMMALGITEQTYSSPSRMKPADVKQTYYQGCVRHELAQR
ncbi:MAG: hypothetical protein JWQ69_5858 [Pseudomonas sp.]|nr:hypothetical protein [Pseudomonas sp.]